MNKKILHEVIDQVCIDCPENTAIEAVGNSLSYGQLKIVSDQISSVLTSVLSSGDEQFVAVFMPSGIEYITAIIGVNKAGAVFMPLEIGFPAERSRGLIERVKPQLIITTEEYVDQLNAITSSTEHSTKVLEISIRKDGLNKASIEGKSYLGIDSSALSIHKNLTGDEGNYLIYTSGSTGTPKIILGKHKSLSHFIHWEKGELNANVDTRTIQLAPVSFDVSLRDIFLPLISGGTVAIPNDQIKKNPSELWKFILDNKISVVHMVPSVLKSITEHVQKAGGDLHNTANLKAILLAGEALYNTVVNEWNNTFGDKVQLYNLYGPSETTLAKVFNKISDQDVQYPIIPLGKAISKSVVLILRGKRLCTPGEIGEIYIKSPFITNGYYQNQQLTNSVFIQNPVHNDFEDIIYKTGDLGSYAEDGKVIFKGRMDSQVKIRGNRVELGEIETELRKITAIKESVVKAIESNGELVLCCYLVYEKDGVDQDEIIKGLKEKLPAYMIPSYIVSLDKLPRNLNGKVDKKALPKPTDLLYANKPYTEPKGTVETDIASHFSSVLNLEKVSTTHSFFEMGGHSLSATILVSAIIDHFKTELSLKEFFENPSIRKVGKLISDKLSDNEVSEFSKVEILPLQEYYQTSHGQRRLWVLEELAENSTPYNISAAFQIKGNVEIAQFKKALISLIKAHDSLRTTFLIKNGEVKQQIHPFDEGLVHFEEIDSSANGDVEPGVISNQLKQLAEYKFDLTEFPLFRTSMIKTGGNQYLISFCMHHIISDGWSLQVLFRDLMAAYNNETAASSEIQYKEYAGWQKSQLENGNLDDQKSYWLSKLDESNPIVELPVEFEKNQEDVFSGLRVWFNLPARLSERIKQFAQQADCSEFTLLATAIHALLARYSGQSDFNIGTPLAGRTVSDFQNTIGFFVNTIVLRAEISLNDNVLAGINKMQAVVKEALDNQIYPHDKLIEDLQLVASPQLNPLFNVMVVYHNQILNVSNDTESALEIDQIDVPVTSSKLDLAFEFLEGKEGLRFNIEYRTSLFSQEKINRMGGHLEMLLDQMLDHSEKPFGNLNILAPDELSDLLSLSNHDRKIYPANICMHQLFEKHASEFPNSVAITSGDQSMTYADVNAQANQLAGYLIANNLEHQLIGICLDRSFELIISVLATLKVGGAYLPIDPYNPDERISYILEDAKPAFLISDKALMDNISAEVHYKEVDELFTEKRKYASANLELSVDPLSPAYIIYTSGSTGNPKGALINHHNVVRLYESSSIHMDFNNTDVWPLFHSFGFDLSVWEIFGALMYGGRLVIVPFEVTRNPEQFANLLIDENVSVLTQTPSAFYNIIPHFTTGGKKKGVLKYVIFAGEALSVKRLLPWMEVYGVDSPELINMYGITETTIHVTYHKVSWADLKAGNSVIGKALIDLQTYVLDEFLNPVPQGVRGELYVGGDGVGLGYLNRKELTAERFISNPFTQNTSDIIYKSGDEVRLLPDGTLDYLGRADDQVKIQGFRIELGEVQSAILAVKSIEFGFVKAIENKAGIKQLVGYFKTVDGELLSEESLRKHLITKLPYYMVPQFLISLQEIPLTNNGKIDYRSLPEISEVRNDLENTEKTTDLQVIVSSIWTEQLSLNNQPGLNDNFFELGGHSIIALRIINEISLKLDKQVRLQEFYAAPTIKSFTEFLTTKEEQRFAEIRAIAENDSYPLSPNQKRFWLLEQLSNESANYNITGAYILNGDVKPDLLDKSVNLLIKRHDIMRTVFATDESGQPVQKVLPFDANNQWISTSEDIASGKLTESDFISKIVNTKFDLESGPLFQIVISKISEEQILLVVNIHHIISDGWSVGIIANEICQHYKSLTTDSNYKPDTLSIQYKDYSSWINESLTSDEQFENSKTYWSNVVQQVKEPVLFPFDNAVEDSTEYKGNLYEFSFNAQLSGQISDLVTTKKVSVFAFMMTVLNLLIYKRLGQKEISLGYPASGRDHPQLKDQLGYYMNMLVLHNTWGENVTVKELLEQINKQIIEALDHQFYPLFTLEKESGNQKSNLFETGLSWQNFADNQKNDFDGLPFTVEETGQGNFDAIHPLWFFGEHHKEEFKFQILYKTALYQETTIKDIADDFETIARKVAEDLSFKVEDIFLKTNENGNESDHFLSMLTKNTEELY